MEDKQAKIAEKIRKKEEELKALRVKEAEIKKQEKERKEREKEKWYGILKKELDQMLRKELGDDYREFLAISELVNLVRTGMSADGENMDTDNGKKEMAADEN